jgi:hypothetical protein
VANNPEEPRAFALSERITRGQSRWVAADGVANSGDAVRSASACWKSASIPDRLAFAARIRKQMHALQFSGERQKP